MSAKEVAGSTAEAADVVVSANSMQILTSKVPLHEQNGLWLPTTY